MSPNLKHDSLAEVEEGDLIRRLLSDSHWRGRVFEIHGIPENTHPLLEVVLDELGKKGDIDVLLVNPANPHLATAIQAKRLKVGANAFRSGKPNRMNEIKKLYKQTNLLVDLGFWKAFSFLFIVVDSRTRNLGKTQYDGLTSELTQTIEAQMSDEGLNPNAGLVVFQITQPMDDRPLGAGTFSARVVRLPSEQAQPSKVTSWVKKRLGEDDA